MRESLSDERRVGIAPASVGKLTKLGFEVVVERGAGAASGYEDAQYEEAGATVDDGAAEPYRTAARTDAWSADVVVKVRPPTLDEVERLREGATLVALVYPARTRCWCSGSPSGGSP